MMNHDIRQWYESHLQGTDLYRVYRHLFSSLLMIFQIVFAWGMFGRFALFTAEIGAVVMPVGLWVWAVRLFGVLIVTAPVIDARWGTRD
jgi:hypothetical protein